MKIKSILLSFILFTLACSPEPPLEPTGPSVVEEEVGNEESEEEIDMPKEHQLTISTSPDYFDDEDTDILLSKHYILVHDQQGEILTLDSLANDTLVTLIFNTDERYHLTLINYIKHYSDHLSDRYHYVDYFLIGDYDASTLHLERKKFNQIALQNASFLLRTGSDASADSWRLCSDAALRFGSNNQVVSVPVKADNNRIFFMTDDEDENRYRYKMLNDVRVGNSQIIGVEDLISVPLDTLRIPDNSYGFLEIFGMFNETSTQCGYNLQKRGEHTTGVITAKFPLNVFDKFRTKIELSTDEGKYIKTQVGEPQLEYFPEIPERQVIDSSPTNFSITSDIEPAVAHASFVQSDYIQEERLWRYLGGMNMIGNADAMPTFPSLTDSLLVKLQLPSLSIANFDLLKVEQKTYSDRREYDAELEANYLNYWDNYNYFLATANFLEEGFMEIKPLK